MAQLSAADGSLRQQGYQPMGQAYRQAIPARGLVALPINAQPGSCYMVVAVGDTGVQDIDMSVIGPSGNTIAEDREPDAHPNVAFCAQDSGMHLARINMFAGQGQVLYAVYQGPPGSAASLQSVFGGGGGAAVAQSPTTPDPSTAARIASFNAQMQSQGYRGNAPVGVAMRQGQEQSWQVNLTPGTCYAFATFGGPGVRDSDVFLFDAAGGRRVAGDAGTAVDATIRDICPPAIGTYQLRARLYSGNGPVWIAAYARGQGGAASGPVASSQPMSIGGGSSAGGIELFYRRVDRDLQSRGYEVMGSSVTGTLSNAGTQDQGVTLTAGSCYAIAAVGDSGVQELNLYLLDGAGNEVDRDHAQSARPVVRVCPQTTGQFTMRVRMVQGEGQYRAGLFRWGGGTSGAGMSGLLFVRNAEVTRILQADGYQGDANFELFRGRVRQGADSNRNVNLESGACYAFVAVGGAGVSDLDLSLAHGRQQVAQDNSAAAFPVARYCAPEGGQYRVTVRSAAGAGDFVFRVFRRQGGAAPSGS
jgi:hypothetical protein